MLLKLRGQIITRFGSLTAFAKVIGVDQPRVSEIIRKKARLPKEEQERWANMLGADREELFGSERILGHETNR